MEKLLLINQLIDEMVLIYEFSNQAPTFQEKLTIARLAVKRLESDTDKAESDTKML